LFVCHNRDCPGRKIDQEAMLVEHARPGQDLVAFDECRLSAIRPLIESRIDKEDVFLDLLTRREKRDRPPDELRVYVLSINGDLPFENRSPSLPA
jgi:hypothetical protein